MFRRIKDSVANKYGERGKVSTNFSVQVEPVPSFDTVDTAAKILSDETLIGVTFTYFDGSSRIFEVDNNNA